MPKHVIKEAHCNNCGGDRNHQLLKKHIKIWESPVENNEFSVSGGDMYYLLECMGCNQVKLLHESWFSEDCDERGEPYSKFIYYPPSIFRPYPKWLSSLNEELPVTKLITEIYQAMQNNAPSLSAMGIRAVIELLMIDKVGDHGSFAKNLSECQTRGVISVAQRKVLDAALELGHATIHRKHTPTKEQLEVALDIMENLVHEKYLLEGRAKASMKKIPKRAKFPNRKQTPGG